MDLYKILTYFYGSLRNYGMPYWIFSPLRRSVRILANTVFPKLLSRNTKKSRVIKNGLLVSFTSFPERINDVWMVVECLKRQTILPEKIILWLSIDQFPNKNVPNNLINEVDELFEIRFVENDIRSHKKYFYVLKEYPEKDFITCDDDVFYDPYMIERLLNTSELYPKSVIANHTSHIQYSEHGELLPYSKWIINELPYASENQLQIGVGGVLYPRGTLHRMAQNQELFMALTPTADDIWLNAMARLNGTKIVQSERVVLTLPIINDSIALCSINNGPGSRNDKQLNALRKYFSENNIEDIYVRQ